MNNVVTFPNIEALTQELYNKAPDTAPVKTSAFPALDKLNWEAKFGHYLMATGPNEEIQAIPQHLKKPVFRNDTKEYLGDCGAGYKIAQNNDLWEVLTEACEAGLPRAYKEKISLKESMGYNGRFTKFSLNFDSSGKEIRQLVKNTGYSKLWNGGQNTLLNLGFDVINSFGGGSPVIIRAVVTDLACTNGMVMGIYDTSKRRHTSGYSPEYFIPFIQEQVRLYEAKISVWEAWAKAEITPTQAKETLEGMGIAAGLTEKFMEQLDVEAQSRGHTVWALYSALTYYSSHNSETFAVKQRGEVKDNELEVLTRRQSQVSSWISTEAWNQLAGVAA